MLDSRKHPQQPVADRLLASRAALLAEAVPGLAAARALSALTDEAVAALAAGAEGDPGGPWAVIALGGYGAGRLLPGSDLDLLVLSDAPPARVKPFAEAVFYPLWDSGLPVGHQVRSRRQHLAACATDMATLTASLTGRVVAGDAVFGERLLADVATRARKARKRVLPEVLERPREGSPFMLEPDLKEDAGGQRDLDELVWTGAVLSGFPAHDASPLTTLALLTAEETAALDAAADSLAAARWRLHERGERRRDLLTPEAAEDLTVDAEALTAARADVAYTLERVRRRVTGTEAPPPVTDAATLFEVLGDGPPALPRLEEAAWAGDLEGLVPGLRALMPLRRPGLAHTRTVGAHCLAAAAYLAALPHADRFAAAALAALPDRRPLLAAALTHDFGKAEPGPDHGSRGEPAARVVAERLGVAEAADDVAVLVREHLLLVETAARADVADEDAVLRVAARLGRRDLVAPLYLLTVADTLATSEDRWTPWRAAIVADLTARLDEALTAEVEGAGVARDANAVRSAALALLDDDASGRAFVEAAPLRYLASSDAATVAAQAALAAPLVGTRDPGEVRIAVGIGPTEGTWQVTIATLDRPGLFALLSGVLALSGLSILGADAFGGPKGTVIDVFTTESATLAPIDTSTWAGFERMLRAALGGRLDLETRLDERRRHYPSSTKRGQVRVWAGRASAFSTPVHVEAPDRVGLLHDLALAISADGMDIRSATILTLSGVASDTFRVVDASGEPPVHPAVLDHLVARMRRAGKAKAGSS